jgi:isoleucyl-tRNA synthetase
MSLIIRLASLGHAAREQAGLKVRQPLAEIDFLVGSREEAAWLERYADLLADELNVKQVRRLGALDEAILYSLKPLSKQLGQKHKALFPKVSQAILALRAEEAAPRLLSGESLQVEVDGTWIEVLPEEVEVIPQARPGLAVAAEGAYLAALHTGLTQELVREGLAREFVRRVQDFRKRLGFDIADRIRLFLNATPELSRAIEEQRAYIMAETLAVELLQGPDQPAKGSFTSVEFEGERVTLGILKVG